MCLKVNVEFIKDVFNEAEVEFTVDLSIAVKVKEEVAFDVFAITEVGVDANIDALVSAEAVDANIDCIS